MSALADSPISRLLVSTAKMAAAVASRIPMATEPAPSHRPLPVSTGQRHAGEREPQADQRGQVLEQDHGEFGGLGPADEGDPAPVAAYLVCLGDPGPQRERLEHRGQPEDDEGDHRGAHRLGVQDLVQAVVDREGGPDGEQHDRHHEPVEVALAPEPERMLLRAGPLGPAAPDDQQHLVAGVGDRVHGLGQQRRGPGEQERHELDHRDAQVGGQRGENRSHGTQRYPHGSTPPTRSGPGGR